MYIQINTFIEDYVEYSSYKQAINRLKYNIPECSTLYFVDFVNKQRYVASNTLETHSDIGIMPGIKNVYLE